MDTVELVGYLASALVVLSLLMTSLLRLRVIGLVGASVFTVYGVLIGSVPVMITNGAIIVIQVTYLWRLWRQQASDSYFEVVRWPVDGVYLPRFLEFHADDIRRSQPRFDGPRDDHLAWVVLRDAVPVGALLAREVAPGVAHIDLDYVTPAHRDLQAGRALFRTSRVFDGVGIQDVRTHGDTDAHRRYLITMGFEPSGDGHWSRPV